MYKGGSAPPPSLVQGFPKRRRARKGQKSEDAVVAVKLPLADSNIGRYDVPAWVARRPPLDLGAVGWRFLKVAADIWGGHAYRCPTCFATGTSPVAWAYYALFGPPPAIFEDEIQLLAARDSHPSIGLPPPFVPWDGVQELLGQMAWRRPLGPHPGAPMYNVQLYCDFPAVRDTYRGSVIEDVSRPPAALGTSFAAEMGISKTLRLQVTTGTLTPKAHAHGWGRALHETWEKHDVEWTPATALATGFFCRQFAVAPCERGTEILLLMGKNQVTTVIAGKVYGTITDPPLVEALVNTFIGGPMKVPRDPLPRDPCLAFTTPLAILATS